MKVRITRTVFLGSDVLEPGAEYEGPEAKKWVEMGKAVPVVPVETEPPAPHDKPEVEYKTPSGKTVKTKARKAGVKRGARK